MKYNFVYAYWIFTRNVTKRSWIDSCHVKYGYFSCPTPPYATTFHTQKQIQSKLQETHLSFKNISLAYSEDVLKGWCHFSSNWLSPPSQCKQVPAPVSQKKDRRLKIDYLISLLPPLGGVSAAFHLLSAAPLCKGCQPARHPPFLSHLQNPSSSPHSWLIKAEVFSHALYSMRQISTQWFSSVVVVTVVLKQMFPSLPYSSCPS